MSNTATAEQGEGEETTGNEHAAIGGLLPADVRSHFNGQLVGRTVVAWAEFDVDERNQYRRQFVVLTDEAFEG